MRNVFWKTEISFPNKCLLTLYRLAQFVSSYTIIIRYLITFNNIMNRMNLGTNDYNSHILGIDINVFPSSTASLSKFVLAIKSKLVWLLNWVFATVGSVKHKALECLSSQGC